MGVSGSTLRFGSARLALRARVGPGLRIGHLPAAVSWRLLRQADDRREVVEIEPVRPELAGQVRHLLRAVEGQFALHVGVAQLAVDVAHPPDLALLGDMALQRVAGRRRQHDADQFVQVREVLAFQVEHRVRAVERGQAGDGAARAHAGRAGGCIHLQREGILQRRAQVQHVAGAALGRERLLLPRPLRGETQGHLRGRGRGGRAGLRQGQGAVDGEVGPDVRAVLGAPRNARCRDRR